MFEYMTVQEAAKLWKLSERQVQKLCETNRIDGVVRLSRIWLIPRIAKKPADARRKENKLEEIHTDDKQECHNKGGGEMVWQKFRQLKMMN